MEAFWQIVDDPIAEERFWIIEEAANEPDLLGKASVYFGRSDEYRMETFEEMSDQFADTAERHGLDPDMMMLVLERCRQIIDGEGLTSGND